MTGTVTGTDASGVAGMKPAGPSPREGAACVAKVASHASTVGKVTSAPPEYRSSIDASVRFLAMMHCVSVQVAAV